MSHLPFSKTIKQKNIYKAKLIWARNITNFNKQRSITYHKDLQKILKKHAAFLIVRHLIKKRLSKQEKKEIFFKYFTRGRRVVSL